MPRFEATERERIYRENERLTLQQQGRTADMGTQQHWDRRMEGLRQARLGGRVMQPVTPSATADGGKGGCRMA